MEQVYIIGRLQHDQYKNLIGQATSILEQAIRNTEAAIELAPTSSVIRANLFKSLSSILYSKFNQQGSPAILDRAVDALRLASLEIPHHDLSEKLGYMYEHAHLRFEQFFKSKSGSHLIEAEIASKSVLQQTPQECADKPKYLYLHARILAENFRTTGRIDKLDEAIPLMKQAFYSLSEGDSMRPECASHFTRMTTEKYFHSSGASDHTEAIYITKSVISTASGDSFKLFEHLYQLGLLSSHMYRFHGDIDDLAEATDRLKQSLQLCPSEHPERLVRLSQLGQNMLDKFLKGNNPDDLDQSILLAREVLNAASKGTLPYLTFVSDFIHRLHKRYETSKQRKDLDEAIDIGKSHHSIMIGNEPFRLEMLKRYVDCLLDRWWVLSDREDMNDAIRIATLAVAEISDNDPAKGEWLTVLGDGLFYRHVHTHDMEDLEAAISNGRQAVHMLRDGSEASLSASILLAKCLKKRYERLGVFSSLTEAAKYAEKALEVALDSFPVHEAVCLAKVTQISSLALKDGSIIDNAAGLDAASGLISLHRLTVKHTPKGHIEWPTLVSGLSTLLHRRFKISDDINDLNEAIVEAREAVDALGENEQQRARFANAAAGLYKERHALSGDIHDRDEMVSLFNLSLNQTQSPVRERLTAAKLLILHHCREEEKAQAFDIAEFAVGLIPHLVMRSLRVSDSHELLHDVGGLSSEAAALALRLGRDPFYALDLLEKGRGIVSSYLDQLNTDIRSLDKVAPELTERFSYLRDKIRRNADSNNLVKSDREKPRYAGSRFETGIEFDELLADIRKQPGFEHFLLPATKSEVMQAAIFGPIVVINAAFSGCDAILVEHYQIHSIPLPGLDLVTVGRYITEGRMSSPEALEYLWHSLASPVLNSLGLSQVPDNDEWPHIWWVMTGLLLTAPVHAAGLHAERSGQTVVDRVISSYHTSVQSIIRTRKRDCPDFKNPTATLIGIEFTPGLGRLHDVPEEISVVREACRSMSIGFKEPELGKDRVLEELMNSQIFHFAGHGVADRKDPLKSYLHIAEERSRSISVADLLEFDLQGKFPFMAYLSACSTGQIEGGLMDESTHIVGAFQCAGFRHVVGTLWEVEDKVCVDMARIIYQALKDRGLVDHAVSWGLHIATRLLRDRWIAEQFGPPRNPRAEAVDSQDGVNQETRSGNELSRKITLCDDDDVLFLNWVPYVHYGV
ncbi:tpr domain-containing protein [Fusarium flagelliforme]|uniref:Tpr domain-containing protein n=1 Tax=Fusarium flagelliforme TaxID=2675880 RepID=A0A395MCS7_9HYPO|nr:tpr domain-containing protein [Fusarium flagelliforme]